MKKKLIVSVISCLFCFCVNAQSYKNNFIKALNANDMVKAEEILKAWDMADSNSPDLFIAYFNYYTIMSKNALPLIVTGYDSTYSKKALEFISEGIVRFPTRFDMRIAKLSMLRELKKYPDYVSEILQVIAYSRKIENNWKGEDYVILDYAEDMLFGAVLEVQEVLFSRNDPSLYKDIIRISEEMLKYYPKHARSLLACSTVYIAQKDLDKSLEALKKAIALEPTNAIFLYNMAYVYKTKGDKVNAKKYYELTITHSKEQEEKIKENAIKHLNDLRN